MTDNFQDNIAYGNSTLSVSGNAVQVGDGQAGAKSIIVTNNNGAGHLAWNPNGTVTANIPDGGGTLLVSSQALLSLSAGAGVITSGQVIFSNSNGVSFGVNGQTVTASHNGITTQTNQTIGLYAIGNTTQNSSTTLDARSLSFNGLGAATVGYSNGSVQVSAPVQTQFVLSNSNGISFGTNGSTVTATYTVPNTAGLISNINVSAGTTSNNLSALTFSNSNGLAFGLNGSTITGSYTVPTQTNQTVGVYALGNTTGQSSSSTIDARSLSFSGSGNISVGYSGGSIIIGQTGGGGQSNQTLGLYALGNTTQNSSTTFDARTLSFNGLGGATVGYSNGSIQISAPTTAGLISNINVSAGTTSNNLSALTFSNANGLAFGLNGSTITGSYTVPTQTNQTVGLYALGNTTQNSSTTLDARTLSFNGLGAATVGYSNGSIQVSVPVQSAQTQSNIQALYDGANSITTGTVRFSNSNGISFGINAQVITASHNGITSQTNQTIGLYALGNTTQNSSTTLDGRTLSFNGLGGNTVGYSNGSIQISGVTTNNLISNINFSAGTTSNNLSAITFSNSNGVSFGLNGSVVTASVQAGAAAGIGGAAAGTQTQTSGTLVFANSNGVTFGMSGSSQITASVNAGGGGGSANYYAVGNTTQNSSTTMSNSISFNALGAMTMGYSNGSVQVSAPATSSLVVTGGLSLSSNGSTISIFQNAVSRFVNEEIMTTAGAAQNNSSVSIFPVQVPYLLNYSNIRVGASVSVVTAANTSSAFFDLSYSAVIYSRTGSTLSSIASGSNSFTTFFQSASNTTNFVGARGFTMDMNGSTQLPPGEYWVALHFSTNNTATGGANTTAVARNLTMFVGGANLVSALGLDPFGSATASTRGASIGLGMVSTNNTMASIAISNIVQTGTSALAAKIWCDFRNYSLW